MMGTVRRLVILAVGVLTLMTACTPAPADSLVVNPGPDASPEQVTQALVDAINAGDRGLVEELAQPDHAGVFLSWIEDGSTLTFAELRGRIEAPLAGAGTAYPDGVGVILSFIPQGTDESMTDGERITWTVLLTDSSGRWRAYDWGAG